LSGPKAPGAGARNQSATLYHYTDACGLLGIIESRSLWATDFRYLNQGEELLYPYESLLAELEGYEFPLLAAVKSRLDQICMARAADPTGGVFVACLSAAPDDAGQWARHGGDGSGYALRFDVERLTGTAGYAATSERGRLRMRLRDGPRRVGYGDEWRDSAIERIAGLLSTTDGGAAFDIIAPGLAASLLDNLALIKHGGFVAEQEWRLVVHAVVQSMVRHNSRTVAETVSATADVKLRVTGSGALTPYVAIAFEPHALVEVVVGPAAMPELQQASVEKLLRYSGFAHARVSASQLPYRTER
jgi:hypothetical protein